MVFLVKWPVIPNFFVPLQGNIADGALAATLKHCDNCGNLVVLFTCSCCVFLASWLRNVVALSQLFRRLWPLHIIWLSWAVLSLCLFPVNFTQGSSDVKPTINGPPCVCLQSFGICIVQLDFEFSSSMMQSTHFLFFSRRRKFCHSLDTPTLVPW